MSSFEVIEDILDFRLQLMIGVNFGLDHRQNRGKFFNGFTKIFGKLSYCNLAFHIFTEIIFCCTHTAKDELVKVAAVGES